MRSIQQSFKELILSPQSELFDVRRYLVSNGYLIEYEHMLCIEGARLSSCSCKKMKESAMRKSIVTGKRYL